MKEKEAGRGGKREGGKEAEEANRGEEASRVGGGKRRQEQHAVQPVAIL